VQPPVVKPQGQHQHRSRGASHAVYQDGAHRYTAPLRAPIPIGQNAMRVSTLA
jgi:hypothetical protein